MPFKRSFRRFSNVWFDGACQYELTFPDIHGLHHRWWRHHLGT